MTKTLLALAAAALTLPAQAALTTSGSLMFTSFNADEDGFAMVALDSIDPNTKVYFSDNEWSGSSFNTGESYSSWTSGSATNLRHAVGRPRLQGIHGAPPLGLSSLPKSKSAPRGAFLWALCGQTSER